MDPVVDLLDAEWRSIIELCASFDDADWQRPTDCPGWSVQDNVSHIIGIENLLLGEPVDPLLTERPAHVRNDAGAFNEAAVAARRGRPGREVLDELATVTTKRLAALRALPDEKWDEVGPTPTGPGPYRHFMRMRVFDSWVHEQDI
ncbi:MAG TPA: maleylpyruvate isomerase N-terminal domain-containing protein, partial [Acidimicrobiales bacterium]